MTADETLLARLLNLFAGEVYLNAKTKGFHDIDDLRSDVENYSVWTANLHGEVSGLWEAARQDELPVLCNKSQKMRDLGLPQLTCEEEGLADIVILALGTAAARGVDIGKAILAKHYFNKSRLHKHGGKLA